MNSARFACDSRMLYGKPVEQALVERGRVRDRERAVVDGRAVTALGHEELVPRGVVDDAEHHVALDLERDRDGEDRQAVRIVRRPVQGIDDPAAPRAAGRRPRLLGEDGIAGERAPEAIDDQRLAARVHLRHEVGGTALVGDTPDAVELFPEEMTGGAGGVDRDPPFGRMHPGEIYHTLA